MTHPTVHQLTQQLRELDYGDKGELADAIDRAYDARVTELLNANNRLVEELRTVKQAVQAAIGEAKDTGSVAMFMGAQIMVRKIAEAQNGK